MKGKLKEAIKILLNHSNSINFKRIGIIGEEENKKQAFDFIEELKKSFEQYELAEKHLFETIHVFLKSSEERLNDKTEYTGFLLGNPVQIHPESNENFRKLVDCLKKEYDKIN